MTNNAASLKVTASNTYQYGDTEAQVEATKVFTGRGWTDEDSFEFTLAADASNPEGATLPTTMKLNATKAQQTVTFDKIKFTKAGTYKFTITETVPEGAVNGVLNGITYDGTPKEITIVVVDDGKGNLVVTNNAASLKVTASNTYSAIGEGEIKVKKILNGREWITDDSFTFTLSAAEGTPMPAKTEITITKDSADKTESFGKITYSKAGTYTYTVKETKGSLGGVEYDETEHNVTIKVVDDGEGHLVPENGDTVIKTEQITNTYDAKGNITLGGKKFISRRDFVEGDSATMKIEAITEGAPMPNPSEVTVKPTEGTNIDYVFGTINYKLSDLPEGANSSYTFKYKVTESTFSMKGVEKKDSREYAVEIQVTDNNTGKLTVERIDTQGELNFTNTYDAEGNITLGGKKFIDRRDFVEGDSATMKIEAITENAPMPDPSEVTVEPTEGTNIDYVFGTINYKLSDLPDGANSSYTFEYKVTESAFSMKGVEKKDSREYAVKIQVTDNSTGKLDVKRIDTEGDLNFTNTYNAKGSIPLYAKKIFLGRGRTLNENEFKFDLYLVGQDASGNETLKPIQTNVGNAANNLITFVPIQYTEQDMLDATYDLDANGKKISRTKQIIYRVAEVPGNDPTIIYDQRTVDITVTLVDDLAGKITATANPDATNPDLDTITVTFTNIVTKILKVDAEHNDLALPGAVIEIYDDASGKTEPIFTIHTTEEPIEIEGLEAGKTYRLHEASAPTGYLPWEFDAYFTVDKDGNITVGEILGSSQNASGDPIIWVDDDGIIRVKDTMKKLTAAVHKVWDDEENRDGLRPTLTGITVNLLRNGAVYKSVTLNPGNNWTAILTDLDSVYVEKGTIKLYEYTWSEPEVEGYTSHSNKVKVSLNTQANEGIITTLTNVHTRVPTEIRVRKEWVDDGSNREPITVQLFADKQAVDTVTLSDANGWAAEWTNLPKYKNPSGQMAAQTPIEYTVAETQIPDGYIATITRESETSFVITNTKETGKLIIEKEFAIEPWEPELPDDSPIDIPVIKTWNDNNNADGNRPGSVTVHLLADGVEVASAQLSEQNNWQTVFTGLPRLTAERKKIVYTITEDPVEWYEAEINGYNIRNNYRPELTSMSVRKVWDDDDNAQKIRPRSIIMTLTNNVTTQKWIVELNRDNNWSATVENLPTRINGQPVTYTWTEPVVAGYKLSSVRHEGNVTIFTNTIRRRKDGDNPGGKLPDGPGDTVRIDDYDTPLGVEIMINHVGDCFD